MKKIFMTIVAVAAIAACSKTEVQYENSAEIGFTPVAKNVTKAAKEGGTLDTNDNLGVWAFWNYDQENHVVTGETGAIGDENTYAGYQFTYLNGVEFVNKTGTEWGGETAYPWPTNGALVFAGYAYPKNQTISATYTLNGTSSDTADDDVMTFTNYTQSLETNSTYDLCWFGATASSYDRASGVVPVTLSHALTWITFDVVGEAATASWYVTKLVLNDIKNVGTGTCVGTTTTTTVDEVTTITPATATWVFAENAATSPMTIYNSTEGESIPTPTTATPTTVETTPSGTVIIPQKPTTVTVEWKYTVGSNTITEQRILPLALSDDEDLNIWKAGVHYTYTLTFKSNEIRISPVYSGWGTESQSVTVE